MTTNQKLPFVPDADVALKKLLSVSIQTERCVMLSFIPSSMRTVWSHLPFGGFDSPEIVTDVSHRNGFLAFTYPLTSVDELAKESGSIDLEGR
jgi:hypothetical protein